MSEIKLTDVLSNRNILSPSNYSTVNISSNIQIPLKQLIKSIDKGIEIGSNNYVGKSDYKFIRTSAFTDYKFSIVEDNNSIMKITSNSYVDMKLKKNDILICKDSNVGEVVILDKDYNNYMFSSGINRLNIEENRYYIYSVMKNKKFKEQFISKIPKGATIMHGKDLYLDCIIPFPSEKKIINYVEALTKIVINKENEMKKKMFQINQLIESEINIELLEKESNNFKYPKISQLLTINRLDTGNYTEEYSKIDYILKKYKNGYFYIDSKNINGGNTPKQRAIGKEDSLKYNWITPTYIYDDGTVDLTNKINCNKNNINSNCMLIINRTSKGGLGEYVGISSFYDYEKNGAAQHNQGIYKVSNLSDEQLIYMTCLMNSKIYRKYCANLSMGSKMKELKLNNILSIPFPNFNDDKKRQICNLYYNKQNKKEIDCFNFEKANRDWDESAGVLDLYDSIVNSKKIINQIIEKIYLNENIVLEYKIF